VGPTIPKFPVYKLASKKGKIMFTTAKAPSYYGIRNLILMRKHTLMDNRLPRMLNRQVA
jgi:hypothetical protein